MSQISTNPFNKSFAAPNKAQWTPPGLQKNPTQDGTGKPAPSVARPGGSMAGVTSATGAWNITGPNGTRQALPGQPNNLKPGEAMVSADPTQAQQGMQAALNDRQSAMDAQKRAQGRSDQAIGMYQGANNALDKFTDDFTKNVQDSTKQTAADFSAAKSMYNKSVSGFEDRSAKDAASISQGIQANASQQMDAIRNDPNMPEDVKQQKLAEVQTQANVQRQQAITQVFDNSNNQLAGLRQGAGAGLANIAASEQSLKNQTNSLIEGAKLGAEQYKAQGRNQIAGLLENYPDSTFSQVDTLLQMQGFQQGKNAYSPGFSFKTT